MAVLLICLVVPSSALAFTDIEKDPGQASILSLQKLGVISGVDNGRFAPQDNLTYAQAVQLMVKGFDLNLDRFRFMKEPKASDYFTGADDNAWYAQALIAGHLNGLPLPADLDPDAKVTREQFADLLCQAMLTKGPYAFIEIYMLIGDEASVDPAYMGSIQTLLIAKIAKLDEQQLFQPKNRLTRSQAAVWLDNAIQFVKSHPETGSNPSAEPTNETITVTTRSVSASLNEVILTRGERPNPGYGISVDTITFSGDKAIIGYSLHNPVPGRMYPAMVVEVKTTTYVDSRYTIETEQLQK